MRTTFLLSAVCVLVALGVVGCSKNSSSPTATTTTSTPSFPTVTFTGPKTSSTDPNATITEAYAGLATAYGSSSFFAAFAGTNAVQNGNSWVWSYTVSGFTVSFTQTLQTDGSYTWKWVVNGTNPGSNVTYTNKTLYEGTRSADGKNGEWKVYYDTTTTLAADFVWATTGSGSATTLTGTLKTYNASAALTEQLIIKNNSDASGEVDMYSNGTVLSYKAVWTSTGSGQWWAYNTSGTQTGTGTWS